MSEIERLELVIQMQQKILTSGALLKALRLLGRTSPESDAKINEAFKSLERAAQSLEGAIDDVTRARS